MTAPGGGGVGGSSPIGREQHKETFQIIKEVSDILNTGLDTKSLALCLRLCEEGINPIALAHFIKDWKQNHN